MNYCNEYGYNALLFASYHDHLQVVQYLLQECQIDIYQKNKAQFKLYLHVFSCIFMSLGLLLIDLMEII